MELRQGQSRVTNRIQKLLEQANLKLGSVASNTLGVSGRRMLEAIIAKQDSPEQLAQLTPGTKWYLQMNRLAEVVIA